MRVIAHRGASALAPENTLAAFEAACRAGADAVELDVRRTADGALVVLHDKAVDPTTDGAGRVADLTLEQIRLLDAGSWFAPAFAGQRMPTLDEAVTLLAGHDVDLFCELKGVWSAREIEPVVEALHTAGMASRTLLQSFRRTTVRSARAVAPEMSRGLLVEVWTPDVLHACERLGASACNPARRILRRRPSIVADLHAAGLTTAPWTLDDPTDWQLALDHDVDGIITNDPAGLRRWLDAAVSDAHDADPRGPR